MSDGPRLIDLPVIADEQRGGRLGFAEAGAHIPFQPARAFYLYDLPQGATRGGHAHRADQQFLICLAGGIALRAEHNGIETSYSLAGPAQGLYAPPLTWLDLTSMAPASILLVLTALPYDEADYIRDYETYRQT